MLGLTMVARLAAASAPSGRPNTARNPSESKDRIAEHPEIAVELRQAFVDWFRIGADPIAWKRDYDQQLKTLRALPQ